MGPQTLLLIGVLAIAALLAAALASGMVSLDSAGDGGERTIGGGLDDAYGYYHDREYQRRVDSEPRWGRNGESTDPDDAALGDDSRWQYDGPYRYGPYGSDGMRRRAGGETARDPLRAAGDEPLPDVFSLTDTDPAGGEPVGPYPSAWSDPYYSPYGGYSNPYANRLRMTFGEGYGAGGADLTATR